MSGSAIDGSVYVGKYSWFGEILINSAPFVNHPFISWFMVLISLVLSVLLLLYWVRK